MVSGVGDDGGVAQHGQRGRTGYQANIVGCAGRIDRRRACDTKIRQTTVTGQDLGARRGSNGCIHPIADGHIGIARRKISPRSWHGIGDLADLTLG